MHILVLQACRNIIQQRIELLKAPVEELLRNINGEVDKTLRTAAEEHFAQFPTLASQVRVNRATCLLVNINMTIIIAINLL